MVERQIDPGIEGVGLLSAQKMQESEKKCDKCYSYLYFTNEKEMAESQQVQKKIEQMDLIRNIKFEEANDSCSDDEEEEFKDYFTNPVKRKQYDEKKERAQQRELHSLTRQDLMMRNLLAACEQKEKKDQKYESKDGHVKMILEPNQARMIQNMKNGVPGVKKENPANDIEEDRNYATVSLFGLDVTNPIRHKVIQFVIVGNKFNNFILVVIILNSIQLAMSQEVSFLTEFNEDGSVNKADKSKIIDLAFLIIYTLEMVLKIIAQGFVMEQFSYLRNGWNVLDFVVVIFGWVGVGVEQLANMSAIKVFRLLRPLKTITRLPKMSSLVSTIISSLSVVFDVFILFLLMIIMLSGVFTQLFKGDLRMQCAQIQYNTTNSQWEPMMQFNDYLKAYTFITDVKNETTQDESVDQVPIYCAWNANEEYNRTIPLNYQPPTTDNQTNETSQTNVCNKHNDISKGRYYECIDVQRNPKDNTLGFDNLLLSSLNVFQIATYENWADIMYTIRTNKNQSRSYDILFICSIFLGSMVVLNLMVAVLASELEAAFEKEDQREQELQNKMEREERNELRREAKLKFGYPCLHKLEELQVKEISLKDKKSKKGCLRHCQAPQSYIKLQKKIRRRVLEIQDEQEEEQEDKEIQEHGEEGQINKQSAQQEEDNSQKPKSEISRFENIIVLFILINTLFMMIEYQYEPIMLEVACKIANQVFTVIFLGEMIIKLVGLGIRGYFAQNWNRFDCLIVTISVVELSMSDLNVTGGAFSVLRTFRLLRIFRIVKSWGTLQVLIKQVMESMQSITNLAILIMLYLFIFALLCKQLYPDELQTEEGETSRYSFKYSGNALLSMFVILTGADWSDIMIQTIKSQGDNKAHALMFILFCIIGNWMLLNLFLAILLSSLSSGGDQGEGQEGEEKESDSQTKELQEQDKSWLPSCLSCLKSIKSKGNETKDQGVPTEEVQEILQKNVSDEDEEKICVVCGEYENNKQHKRKEICKKSKCMVCNKHKLEHSPEEMVACSEQICLICKLKKDDNDQIVHTMCAENHSDVSIDFRKIENLKREVKMIIKFEYTESDEEKKEEEVDINKKQTKQLETRMDYSLFLFSNNSPLRMFLKDLISNTYFEMFVYNLIAFNSLLLALDEPGLESRDEYQAKNIQQLQNIISGIFVVECVMKVIVFGFFLGPDTYLRHKDLGNWHMLDFFIVVTACISWIIEGGEENRAQLKSIKAIRALRALRPLKFVNKNQGIKEVVNAFLESIPPMFNVFLIAFLFEIVFGILGLQLLMGMQGECIDKSDETTIIKDYILANQTFNITNKLECEFNYPWLGTDVNQTERYWKVKTNNFNNILQSILNFFEVTTLEWSEVLFIVIDSKGEDETMEQDFNKWRACIFVIHIFLTTFFVMNMLVSVIVDKFNEQVKKRNGEDDFTYEQKEWVKLQRVLIMTDIKRIPEEPINQYRLMCFRIVQSRFFDYMIYVAILVNSAVICADSQDQSQETKDLLEIFNYFFLVFFLFEMLIKIYSYSWNYYWYVNWNKFDFVLVILSLVSFVLESFNSQQFNTTILRILRVTRLLRMIKASKSLQRLLKTLSMSMMNILNVALLLVLILFTSSIVAMAIFNEVTGENFQPEEHVNFKTFYNSFMLLLRTSTGDSWNKFMHDCYNYQNEEGERIGIIANIYWLCQQLLTFFIFMNVFIAVLCDTYNDNQLDDDDSEICTLSKKDIKSFQQTWAKFDHNGEYKMRTSQLPEFLRMLPPPLGFQGIRIEDTKILKIIYCLNIRDHKGWIFYPELMWPLFYSIAGCNDKTVLNCNTMKDLMKIYKYKYKNMFNKMFNTNFNNDKNFKGEQFPAKVNFYQICGKEQYDNIKELTASNYIYIMKLQRHWRRFAHEKRMQRESAEKSRENQNTDARLNEMIDLRADKTS